MHNLPCKRMQKAYEAADFDHEEAHENEKQKNDSWRRFWIELRAFILNFLVQAWCRLDALLILREHNKNAEDNKGHHQLD